MQANQIILLKGAICHRDKTSGYFKRTPTELPFSLELLTAIRNEQGRCDGGNCATSTVQTVVGISFKQRL
jgi:hypothetical protein